MGLWPEPAGDSFVLTIKKPIFVVRIAAWEQKQEN